MLTRIIAIVSLLAVFGCSTVKPEKIFTKTELKYKKVLLLPLVDGTEELRTLAFDNLYNDLKSFPDIEVVDRNLINDQFLVEAGLNPHKYTVIDLSVNAEGHERRQKIKDKVSANAIILASCVKENNTLAMYVQMLDIDDGELSLSFSKVLEVGPNQEETLKTLVKLCADKIIAHIKDNIVMTTIHKYQ
jgi:hypothetical protein